MAILSRMDHLSFLFLAAMNFASAIRRMPSSADSSTPMYSLITSGATPTSLSRSANEYVSGKLRKACSRSLSWSATGQVCARRAALGSVRTYLTLRVNPQTHVLLGLPAASGALIVPTMASRR